MAVSSKTSKKRVQFCYCQNGGTKRSSIHDNHFFWDCYCSSKRKSKLKPTTHFGKLEVYLPD